MSNGRSEPRTLRDVRQEIGEQYRLASQYRQDHQAEQYRLWQSRELLREAGFIEQADGTWVPPDDAVVDLDQP
jgi:hypothetical protein